MLKSFVLTISLLVPAAAYAQVADDDEPAPSNAATDTADQDPVPDEVESDLTGAPDATATAKPVAPPVVLDDGGLGMTLRVSYRTLTNREIVSSAMDFASERYHELGLDAYPISRDFRMGLSVQFGLNDNNHWHGMAGLVGGYQHRGKKLTPWIEGGVRTGVGWRNYYYFDKPAPVGGLTFLYAMGLQLGLDARLGSGVVGSLALGVQKMGYYSVKGDSMNPLYILSDSSVTLMIGIGY